MTKRLENRPSKEVTAVSLDTYLLNRAKELVDAHEFASVSSVISTALSEFLTNYESRKKSQVWKSEMTRPVTIE